LHERCTTFSAPFVGTFKELSRNFQETHLVEEASGQSSAWRSSFPTVWDTSI
jgi:hypothetical protein